MTADPQISQLLESLADRLTTGEDFELEYKAARGGLPGAFGQP
jgi:hypothetical protein